MVAIGLGRPTTILPSTITQPPPTQDVLPNRSGLPSPFPYIAHLMFCAARINNGLNSQPVALFGAEDLSVITEDLMRWYQELPQVMQWSPKK